MTQSDQSDMTVPELLERAVDQLARARYMIADAAEDLFIAAPGVFAIDRLRHVQQELILIGEFLPGLAPAKPSIFEVVE